MCRMILPLLSLVFVAACSMPYKKPEITPGTAVVPGIRQTLESQAVDGVDVVSVHGMCSHSLDSWAKPAHEELAAAFGEQPGELAPVSGVPGLYRASISVGDKDVRHYLVTWSDVSAAAKKTLCYDNRDLPGDYDGACSAASSRYPFHRADYNNLFKVTLLNDCLSDVTFYLGNEGGRAIRGRVRDALAAVTEQRGEDSDVPLFFVTESLGSAIVKDALTKPDGEVTTQKLLDLALAFAPTEVVYMAANQLPLLALADADVSPCGLADFLTQTLRSANAREAGLDTSREILAVAFTDPNDLLSYTLQPDDCPLAINVIVSNARTWFGKIENPLPAHTGYLDEAAVWKLIVDGGRGR